MAGTWARMLLTALAAAALLAGCKGSSHAKQNQPIDESLMKWSRAEITVGGSKVELDIGRFDKPQPLPDLPMAACRRDTAIGTWVSMQSHTLQGKDTSDLKAYIDHFVHKENKQTLSTQFFTDHANDDKPLLHGVIRYKGYTTVVTSNRRAGSTGKPVTLYPGVDMVQQGGKFYIDENAKTKDPVLHELSRGEYKVLVKGQE